MKERALEQLRLLVEKESGIALGPDKTELLRNRIRKRLNSLKIASEVEYIKILETDFSGHELCELLDVVSTNHTFFYREPSHFSLFEDILKIYKSQSKDEVKIWCAASSSGEEPYMLAMVCNEVLRGSSTSSKILATDISLRILQRATRGVYDPKQVEKLPEHYRDKYFTNISDTEESIQIIPEMRQNVTYKRLNLSKFPFPLNGPIDVIFCRNVMIYFELDLRRLIIKEFERLLSPGGWLFLSHSENLLGVDHQLRSHQVGAYQKPTIGGSKW